MEIDPDSLAGALKRHLDEKMTNHVCESCGQDNWTVLVEHTQPSHHFRLTTVGPPGESLRPGVSWPFGGIVCTNCHLVRWFAIAPIMAEWMKSRGGREQQ